MMGIIYGIVIVLIMFVTFASVKERITTTDEERQPFIKNLNVIFANKPFLILSAATILFMIALNMLAAVVNYYFKYNLNAEAMVPVAFLCLFATATLLIPVFVYISNKKSKMASFRLGMGFLGVILILLFFFGEMNMTTTLILFVAAGMGITAVFFCPWAMIPDTVEYSEWKTGLRREGILYGCFFFCFKLGAALAGFFTGLGLDIAGYVPNVAQTDEALLGIRLMITFVPLLFIIPGIILVSFYPIDAGMHAHMLEEIGSEG